ncbi:MAG: hypothetical protein LC114_16055 [Bryobacterales bacterium]|nr:hypothetical protein [Bryobacterales bacterium]
MAPKDYRWAVPEAVTTNSAFSFVFFSISCIAPCPSRKIAVVTFGSEVGCCIRRRRWPARNDGREEMDKKQDSQVSGREHEQSDMDPPQLAERLFENAAWHLLQEQVTVMEFMRLIHLKREIGGEPIREILVRWVEESQGGCADKT